jgi:hypothetical protein
MQTPPPVNGAAYPMTLGAEARSNYVSAGLTVSAAYDDNVIGGDSAAPVGDVIYSIWPSIMLGQTTPRIRGTLMYSPGFTIYHPTSALNQVDQNAAADFQYLLSPHLSISLQEAFQQSSNAFNQPQPGISGSGQAPPVSVIVPFANRLTNETNVELTYQFARDAMIGGSGMITSLNYPNPAQVPGISNSSSRGGSAFYARRFLGKQYIGEVYEYSRILASPTNEQTETQTNTFSTFYTFYFMRTLSVSLGGGPQNTTASQSFSPTTRTWAPSIMASVGWQGTRTSFAASYLRTVTGGGGLIGAFNSNNGAALARWQVARTWTLDSTASYSVTKNANALFVASSPGGHTFSGTILAQHSLGQHLTAQLGYDRLHQSYDGIAVISTAPDSNRVFFSLSYQLTRPLGR